MNHAPKRIQRKRTKGWRMPAGAVYVGRPTKWGNPWGVGHWLEGARLNSAAAVQQFRHLVHADSEMAADAQRELRGKDLACWCPLVDKDGNKVPCHADVLLELANSVTEKVEGV